MVDDNSRIQWRHDDNARMAAAFRAFENESAEPLVRDEFASLFAGKRGVRLIDSFPGGPQSATGSVVRTILIDEFIAEVIETQNVDAILCLGAGFDARPYRLNFPENLTWIEVDFLSVIQRKNRLLQRSLPSCNIRRYSIDLLKLETFAFSQINRLLKPFRKVVVVSEGLLIYLQPRNVETIAAELFATSKIHSWITDLGSPPAMQWMDQLAATDPFWFGQKWSFAPANPVEEFQTMGWQINRVCSSIKRAESHHRPLISEPVKTMIRANGWNPDYVSTVVAMNPL